MTAAPNDSRILATDDFPEPIPPASPMIGLLHFAWNRDNSFEP
jgi:hypothetical protein